VAQNAFKTFAENLNDNPLLIVAVAQAIIPVLLVFEYIHWTTDQVSIVYTALGGIAAVFVSKTTVSASKVEQRVEEKVAHREMAGTTGTGEGLTPPPTPGPATSGIATASKQGE
jgi:hypothetical protein